MNPRGDGFSARILLSVFVLAWATATSLAAAGGRPAAAQPSETAAKSGPATSGTSAPAAQASDYVGAATCITCHDSEGKSLGRTLHGHAQNPRTPAATGQSCETCHGPGKAHVDGGGDKEKIKRFSAMPARDISDTCVTCHNRGVHTQWKGSPHDSRNLSCTTCHSVHDPKSEKAQLKTATEIETCATCHKPQAMKVRRTQHMPISEGKMSCTSCHNPHGSTNVKQLKVGNWVNESCVSCHTEKRGRSSGSTRQGARAASRVTIRTAPRTTACWSRSRRCSANAATSARVTRRPSTTARTSRRWRRRATESTDGGA